MKLYEAIIHCEEVANDRAGCCEDCVKEHRQLAEWLKCLAKISDMLDGTIDHLSGDDAKELLSDIKWELKLAKLTEV